MSSSGRSPAPTPQDEDQNRARQVIQHFFQKAALTVVCTRCNLPRVFLRDSNTLRSDKWFNLILDDSDVLQEDVKLWSTFDFNLGTPPPLFLEIFLETSDLPRNQTIVIIDERRQRWNACEALEPSGNTLPSGRNRKTRNTKVVLERWKITLDEDESGVRFDDSMPSVYKKSVVMFRTLFTLLHQLPAYAFNRRVAKEPASLNTLRPMYRVSINGPSKSDRDALEAPLYPSQEPATQREVLRPVSSPAGLMGIEVTYRNNCDFRVDDAEALLSMQFMGADVPHHPSTFAEAPARRYSQAAQPPGSLPAGRQADALAPVNTAYGSMSTFHGAGAPLSTSPVSALRAARDFNNGSPVESPPLRQAPDQRSSQSSKSSLKPEGASVMPRRVSVSFQPFKAGSLSSSPGRNGNAPASPRLPSGETSNSSSGAVSHMRKPSSQTSIPQSGLREGVSAGDEHIGSSGPSSPKPQPVQRFSSSFGHRRTRLSGGGNVHRNEDDQNSSGKASQASDRPGSGQVVGAESGSSESMHADDSNISEFLNFLEAKKNLTSLNKDDETTRDASARRTSAQLSKFQRMRDSHAAVSESISTSMLHQPSSGPGSLGAKPSSVPPQLSGASVSTSSSPGKDISPRTPHTPAVPSRLSTHANVDNQSDAEPPQRSSAAVHRRHDSLPQSRASGGSNAIDIPTSPHRYYRPRVSSSAAQPHPVVEDELGMRAASVPIDAPGTDLSLSELFNANEPPRAHTTTVQSNHRPRQDSRDEEGRRASNEHGSRPSSYRPRLYRGGASGRGSYSSAGTGSGQASGSADTGHGRFSVGPRRVADTGEEEEPLLFTMSELEQQSRRSLERLREYP
ncbi:MAG: hypothetical protein Q9162_005939 [Coniocarpon cinnabarinum]